MDLDPSSPSREDCWATLPTKVMIGTSRLRFAEPRVNADHKPVYSAAETGLESCRAFLAAAYY